MSRSPIGEILKQKKKKMLSISPTFKNTFMHSLQAEQRIQPEGQNQCQGRSDMHCSEAESYRISLLHFMAA